MSSVTIKDSSTGYIAEVNSSKRLQTRSVTVSEQQQRSNDGYGFNLNTGTIALTSANESAVMYVKYTGTKTLHIQSVAVGVGKLGVSSDPVLVKMYRNPTNGTIVTNAVAGVQFENRNFGTATQLTSDFYKGVEGDTLTGGDMIAQFYANQSNRLFADIDFILPPQTSIGISLTPNDDGTGGNVYVALICHEEIE